MMKSSLDSLNPAQREAAEHFKGPLLIFAGAGSGKTRVLTHRIAHLIGEHGVSPFQILAVTFTNKAAAEMRERVEKLLDVGSDEVTIATFHSFGLRILRREGYRLGLSPSFSIYDADDQMSLIKKICEDLSLNPKMFHPKNIMAEINQAKNELLDPSAFAAKKTDFYYEKIAKAYALYQNELIKNNAVDFGDLILLPVKLCQNAPEVLKRLQEQYPFIMVDEYQDTNHAQYVLIKMLSEAYQNLCVVGDDDQSIYRWRGADLRNILDFERDFENVKVIKLEQNYRSTSQILNSAYEVVKHIEQRQDKKLWTENPPGEKIHVYEASTEKGEASFIVRQITKFKEAGHSYKDHAIFYRTNSLSRVLEDELMRAKIPYIIVGGIRFYDRKEIKDILAYLTLMVNPASSLHFKRVVNVPARGLGKQSLDKIELLAKQKNKSLWEMIQNSSELNLSAKTAFALKNFVSLITKYQLLFQEKNLHETLKNFLEESTYLSDLKLDKSPEAADRIENLAELVSVLRDYEERSENANLATFLEEVALIGEVNKKDKNSEAVNLMTLHLAKGLEFDHVFLVGLEEGLFPHSRSLEDQEELDEERRLMYVGMTRARKKLYLSSTKTRMIYGREQINLPSRFLKNIPREYTHTVKENSRYSNPVSLAAKASLSKLNTAELENTKHHPHYSIGRKLNHPKFGVGIVQSCSGSDAQTKVTLKFSDGEHKTFIAQFASLTPVN